MTEILSYNKVIQLFRDWAKAKSPMINYFGYGPVWDIATSHKMSFPFMWIDHQTSSRISVQNRSIQPIYSFVITFMDQINDQPNVKDANGNDSNNVEHIMSDMFQLGQDFINDLMVTYSELGIKIIGDVTYDKVYDEFTDKCCGWFFNIDLQIKHYNCTTTTTILPVSCKPVTVKNSDDTYFEIFESGTTNTIPDSNILVNDNLVGYIPGTTPLNILAVDQNDNPIILISGSVSGGVATIKIPTTLEILIPYKILDDAASIIIVTGSEGTINSIDSTGLSALTITVNSNPVTVPFTLVVGDVVDFTFTESTINENIKLNGYA